MKRVIPLAASVMIGLLLTGCSTAENPSPRAEHRTAQQIDETNAQTAGSRIEADKADKSALTDPSWHAEP